MGTMIHQGLDVEVLGSGDAVERDESGERFVRIDDQIFPLRDGKEAHLFEFDGAKWTNGVVRFVFASSVTEDQKKVFREAARLWSLRAKVSFTELTKPDGAYVEVSTVSDSNSATVGMGKGRTVIEIYNWDRPLTVAHEIGHTLGLTHEQCRHDRNDYVTYKEENVSETKWKRNFVKLSKQDAPTEGPYDFASLMHYKLDAFARDGTQTLEVKDQYSHLAHLCGAKPYLSLWDGRAIAKQYGATGFLDLQRIDARSWPQSQSEISLPAMSDAAGGAVFVDLAVPGRRSVSKVRFRTSGGSGDCDLYIRRTPIVTEANWTEEVDEFPWRRRFDKKGVRSTTAEEILFKDDAGTDHDQRYTITLHAPKRYDNMTLTIGLIRTFDG